jgi:hypothetical protein
MRRKILVSAIAAALLLAFPLIVWGAAKPSIMAHLSGSAMVPPVQTEATGYAVFKLSPDGKSIHYQLVVQNIKDVNMAHIHLALAGQNAGAPVAWLYPAGPPPVVKPGMFSGTLAEGNITAANFVGALKGKPLGDLLRDLNGGKACVVVHTKANPAGEIRGQIENMRMT